MHAGDDYDPKRVLVVDDEGPMLRTHGRVLEAYGMRPVLMSDPAEALEQAKEHLPAVVLVDLVMPGMSGLEYVTRLRSYYGRSCPPVILVSANHAQLSPMEQLMFDGVFPKPFSIDGLGRLVVRLAARHAERRQASSDVVRRHGLAVVSDDESEGER